jgi:protoheme IX farnesyltransferase
MNKVSDVAGNLSGASSVKQMFSDFNALVKLRLSLTVVFSSTMAYLIALEGTPSLLQITVLSLGGFLVTGAANILNEVLERDFDKLMRRTANRPLASGRMDIANAVLMAGFMSLFGITFLALFNTGTALLGTIALVSYAFLYTPLKRVNPAAVTIGAIAGALPTLIGCVAAQNTVSLLGITLFSVQFLWQFTHFWSIAFLGFEDYQRAGYKFIPTDFRSNTISRRVGTQAFVNSLLLLLVVFVPYFLGIVGVVSTVFVALISLCFSYFAWNFYSRFDKNAALKLMFSSFLYIPLVLLAYFFDKLG